MSTQICSGNLHPTKNAFFRRDKGLEKNYELTGIGIGLKQRSGLRENFVKDGGIEEPHWGPSYIASKWCAEGHLIG